MDDLAILLHHEKLESSELKVQKNSPSIKKLRSAELKLFASSLASLLEGGIPILKALDVLQAASEHQKLTSFFQKLQNEIRQGGDLSGAIDCNSGVVPAYFIQIIRAGEASGTMPVVLKELSMYLEKEEALKRKMREALTYPGFILGTGILTLAVLMRFVIPKLTAVYNDFDAELPVITRCIITASNLSLPLFVVILVGMTLCTMIFAKNKRFQTSFINRLPLLGKLCRKFILIQFSSLMGLLMESGITVLESLKITQLTFSDPFLREDTKSIQKNLAEGKGFSSSLGKIKWIDPLSRMLIISGEESGRLTESFRQIARDTESKMESELQWLLKLLEPSLILGVGILAGIVVIGTVLPIFDISGLMK